MECSAIQILRSVEGSRATFRRLGAPKFKLTEQGRPVYYVGNSAIIFVIMHHGVWHCAKCYTSAAEHARREIIYGEKLLAEELYIAIDEEKGVWLDVVLEEWREGETLIDHLAWLVKNSDRDSLHTLSRNFDALALDLLAAQWAHGDITCENIIVNNLTGELHLIDFDNIYTPELDDFKSCELGTEAYQHPARTIEDFDRTIDDYSLALISTSLSLIAHDPETYTANSHLEGLLFDPKEIIEQRSELFNQALTLFEQAGAATELRIAELLQSEIAMLPTLYPLLSFKHSATHPEANPTTIFCHDGLWGYLNDFSREVIPPLFDAALGFSESLAAVKLRSSWHYIDTRGRTAINCAAYEQIKSIQEGRARVKKDGKWLEIEVKR